MYEVIVLLETIALVGLAPGFVAAAAAVPLRRPMDNITRTVQQLPPQQFRSAIALPLVSLGAGVLAGIGSNLIMTDEPPFVGFLLLIGAALFVILGGRTAVEPIRRVAQAAIPHRREVLARLVQHDWSTASREERAQAARQARRLAATGARLIAYAENRTFRQWFYRRNRLLLIWITLATAYTTGILIYVLARRVTQHDWTIRPATLLIVALPVMGPAQLWLRYRENQATLRDLGAELHKEASAVLAAITAAPPWNLRRRAQQAIRLLLNLDVTLSDRPHR